MNSTLDQYAQALEERAAQNTLRSLRPSRPLSCGQIELNGKTLINLASNDYLGLSQHQALKTRAIEFTNLYGVGNGASRLLSGNLSVFEEIEAKLAKLKGTEAALILPSGFQANSSVIPAILGQGTVAAADRLVHRSMIEGLLLSDARWFRFEHNNMDDLNERLSRHKDSRGSGWLLTESVFSMDGDKADFNKILPLAHEQSLNLYIDEAHATGVMGKDGMGLSAGLPFTGIAMGTFGKGLGSFGAYIACSNLMRDYLINFCPGLIYSTALPPPTLGAIDAALDLIPELENERNQLQNNASELRDSLHKMGFDTGLSSSQIIPIVLGSELAALSLSNYLEEHGFYVPAIRPPTVPEGSARLRLSLSAVHSTEQIEEFLQALRSWHEKKS